MSEFREGDGTADAFLLVVQGPDESFIQRYGKKVVGELKHWLQGFRLLGVESKLSAVHLYRLVSGERLSGDEWTQVCWLFFFCLAPALIISTGLANQDVLDLLKVVPFSFFVIVGDNSLVCGE